MKTIHSRNILAVLLVLCVLCLTLLASAAAEEAAAPANPEPAADSAGAGEAQPEESAAEQGDTGDGQAEGKAGESEGETGEDPEGGSGWGGFPGGGGGRMPSGGRFGGGGRGGKSSGVNPGKALTSTHAKGTLNSLRHGAVALSADGETMQTLVLGGEELALSCGGYSFTADVEEDVLVLRSEEGDAWSLTMDVLRTLKLSGIRQLRLVGPDSETELDTDLELTGSLYGKERTRGFVSADFLMTRQGEEWTIRVDDREYRLSGNELS